jgi:hypothetical protein
MQTMAADVPSPEQDAPHRRLQRVRNRLAVLDYREPFNLESLDLVERLVGDLVTTSESFEKLQQRDDRLSQDLALAQVRCRVRGTGCARPWGV